MSFASYLEQPFFEYWISIVEFRHRAEFRKSYISWETQF